MNRKHNPLVAGVALLLLAVVLLLTSCSTPAKAEEPESSPRFIMERHKSDSVSIDFIFIITDTETGVRYLYVDGCNSGGLTVLQPAPEEEEMQTND